MTPIQVISTTEAPAPAGHYSQAIVREGLLFVSGQLPVKPDGTHDPHAGFDAQVRQALSNLMAIVRHAGSNTDQVLKVTAYIVGVNHWPEFNRIYAEIFGATRPARTVVPVPELHYGYLIEIDAIAAIS